LSDCSFIDSSALRVLLTCGTARPTKIVCPSGNVRRLLELVNAEQCAAIYEALYQALQDERHQAASPDRANASESSDRLDKQ
jgi:hypothetical protein